MNPTRKTAALLSTSALAAGAAHGAITYTPVNITLCGHGALTMDLNQDGAPDYALGFNGTGANKPFINNTNSVSGTPFVLSSSANQGLPVTAIGTAINGSYQSVQTNGWFCTNSGGTGVGGWTAAGNVEGYVGLELVEGDGSHFGWAHFIYNSGPAANNLDKGVLTLVDTALETTPGTAIQAGQTAEPSSGPVIVIPPSSQTGLLAATAQLSVTATGSPAPTYQWQAGAVGSGLYTNIPNGTGVIDGAVNTLTLRHLSLANTADYVVVVSNSSSVITSSVPATLTVLPASDTPATLVHRYSFQDTAGIPTFIDSVGGHAWDGTLQGSASLTGSSLHLDGSFGCFASLPSNITSNYNQMTVEFWADIGNNPVWTRVFFFGDQTGGGQKNSGVDYSPYAKGNFQNLDLFDLNHVDAYANNNAGINNTTGNHVTVVVDAANGALCYYNGNAIVSTLQTSMVSLTNINDLDNWIGASPVSTDPYLLGAIYEFRVYQGVLSPRAVALNDLMGAANYIQLAETPTVNVSLSAGNIVLSWPVGDYVFAVQSKSSLANGSAWTTLTNSPVLVGTNWQVTLSQTNSPQFFQLIYK